MVTVDDLSPGERLPAPMVVTVTAVDWRPGKSRRAEVELVDSAGNPLRLVDYEGAEIQIDWKEQFDYRISYCRVQNGGGGFSLELSPSKQTQIDPIGPAAGRTQLLVLGDTHVGRTEHPKTAEEIDPVGAFIAAAKYAIGRQVDAVVHAGDMFHDSATPLQAMLVDQCVFSPLTDAQIPFYYVHGNHSAEPGDEVLADRDGPLVSNLDTDGAPVRSAVRLFGIDHYADGNLPWHDLTFPDSISEPVSVLVVHQTLEQLSGHSDRSIDIGRIQRRYMGQFDIVLSGHHHDAKQTKWRGMPVMYTGAAEKMSKNEEATDRVAWLLTVESGAVSCEKYDIP